MRGSLGVALAMGIATSHNLSAADFPSRPITITNIYAAGGGTDVITRVIGQKLTEKWNVPILVDSKSGAGGTIATAYVTRQPPDGYNLLVTDVSYSIAPSMYAKLAYDPYKDLTPVVRINTLTLALVVNPVVPARSIAELVAYAKANPGKLSYASTGIGSLNHLGAELFKSATGIESVHVPYRGAVPAVTDLIAGRVQMYVGAISTPLPYIKEGKLRALAVMQPTRSPLLPDVPTINEAGYRDLDFFAYYGIFAPAGTPKPIIAKLADGIKESLASPDVRKTLENLGCEASGLGPDEFATFLKRDIETWNKAAVSAGVKLN
jgi:tripartite-type tricarboxylate transporter receptor subunit TctC